MDPSDASASKNLLIGLIKSGETRGKHKGGFNEPSSVSVILKIVLQKQFVRAPSFDFQLCRNCAHSDFEKVFCHRKASCVYNFKYKFLSLPLLVAF